MQCLEIQDGTDVIQFFLGPESPSLKVTEEEKDQTGQVCHEKKNQNQKTST